VTASPEHSGGVCAPTLLAVPNVSEGRDEAALAAIRAAFGAVLHDSADPDHHRAVFALAGAPGELHGAVVAGAREVLARIDLSRHAGVHPRVGALDVAPIVFLREEDRGAACAEALVLADELGELGIPVYLYGELGGGRTRAELRRGGLEGLRARGTRPDFGPPAPHPTAGVTLVAARPPLVAFNVELAPPASLADARAVAARIREGGPEGLPGVRALGLVLASTGVVQVSTNIEDAGRVSAGDVVAAVARHAPVAGAELVAPAPRAALAGLPAGVPLRGPAPIEDLLEARRSGR
jgi:glutamate formiminotransferase / 5-formyltetrahydrofolate cyclo-ligase